VDAPGALGGLGGMMEAIEATLSELVLLGVAVLFLATAEGRTKRSRSLREPLHSRGRSGRKS
jgi:hypothetical protein